MKIKVLYVKRVLFVVGVMFFIYAVSAVNIHAKTPLQSEMQAMGITIPEEYIPRHMSGVQKYSRSRYTSGNLDYTTSVREVLAQNILNPNIHLFAHWVQTSPQQYKTGGILGLGGKGYNWHVEKVETNVSFTQQANLVSILDWTPKNKASEVNGSITVGLSASGPEISGTVDFSHSTLNVTSLTNAGTKHYGTKYTFKDDWNLGNDYNRGTINSIGMFTFEKTGPVWINVKHEIEYWNSLKGVYKNNQSFVNFNNNY